MKNITIHMLKKIANQAEKDSAVCEKCEGSGKVRGAGGLAPLKDDCTMCSGSGWNGNIGRVRYMGDLEANIKEILRERKQDPNYQALLEARQQEYKKSVKKNEENEEKSRMRSERSPRTWNDELNDVGSFLGEAGSFLGSLVSGVLTEGPRGVLRMSSDAGKAAASMATSAIKTVASAFEDTVDDAVGGFLKLVDRDDGRRLATTFYFPDCADCNGSGDAGLLSYFIHSDSLITACYTCFGTGKVRQ